MANTLTTQVIQNGPRNLVLNIYVAGDGSGDESATTLVDASAYGASDLVLESFWSGLSGFTADLLWDATANVAFLHLPDYDVRYTPDKVDGIPNNAGAGKTGDILITTVGLGNGDKGTVMLHLRKK